MVNAIIDTLKYLQMFFRICNYSIARFPTNALLRPAQDALWICSMHKPDQNAKRNRTNEKTEETNGKSVKVASCKGINYEKGSPIRER